MAHREYSHFKLGFSIKGFGANEVGTDVISSYKSLSTWDSDNNGEKEVGTPIQIDYNSDDRELKICPDGKIPHGFLEVRVGEKLSDFEMMLNLYPVNEVAPGEPVTFIKFVEGAVLETKLFAEGYTPVKGDRIYVDGGEFTDTDPLNGLGDSIGVIIEVDSDDEYAEIVLEKSYAELDYADIVAGTITASKALILDADKVLSHTSDSEEGGTSVEPFAVESEMTGDGGVGGRCRFQLDTDVQLGGWANALKGITVFGENGSVTGLGSAVVAEMTLSAGTTAGTYAPLEIELNLDADAETGTATSLIYASVNGDGAGEFNDNGYALYLAGLTAESGHVFQESAVSGIDSTHALRINVGGTAYFIPLHTSASFT
jgi:hypothetical protein